ncbi:MAG: hypothetical protein AAB035_00745 [Nitrospirota bacterium]
MASEKVAAKTVPMKRTVAKATVTNDGHEERKGMKVIVTFDVDSAKITIKDERGRDYVKGKAPVGMKFITAESILILKTNHTAGSVRLNGSWFHYA